MNRIDVEESIVDRFRYAATEYPDRLAVCDRYETLTYSDLDSQSDGLARTIINNTGDTHQAIGILLAQGAASIVAILAVLKSGNFYVSLNPRDHPKRLRRIVQATGTKTILTRTQGLNLAGKVSDNHTCIINVEDRAEPIVPQTMPSTGPDDVAYIFFTSGTTDDPKGVFDSHRNVLHNVKRYTESLRFEPRDRMSLVQAPSFSGTVSTVFGALLNGASLFPYDTYTDGLHRMPAWLRRNDISILHCVPALYRVVFGGGSVSDALRLIRLEGDRATAADLALFEASGSPATLVNGLGLTETGLVSQFFPMQNSCSDGGVLPVGHAVSGMHVSVVDRGGKLASSGEIGEIAVRSHYLALGYWRDSSTTATRFIRHGDGSRTFMTRDLGRVREDGSLEVLGRMDRRARVRGQWVELAEVEAELLRISGVEDAAVDLTRTPKGDDGLEAFVICSTEQSAKTLRENLSRSLQSHMIPEKVTFVAELPCDSNGKIDRKSIRGASITAAPPSDTRNIWPTSRSFPSTFVQRKIATIWEKELGRTRIPLDEDFFAVGGNSLIAARIIQRAERALGTSLLVEDLLNETTIRAMADKITAQRVPDRHLESPLLIRSALRERRSPPVVCIHATDGSAFFYGNLVARLRSDAAVYAFSIAEIGGLAPPCDTIPGIAATYVQRLKAEQPQGPYRLVGNCIGSVIAFEMAIQLESCGDVVETLLLLDDTLPAHLLRRRHPSKTGDRFRKLLTATRNRSLVTKIRDISARKASRLAHAVTKRLRSLSNSHARTRAAIAGGIRGAWRSYRPGLYHGPIDLVRSDMDAAANGFHRLGWSNLTTDVVRCHTFQGHGDNMFRDPEVETVARVVDRLLSGEEISINQEP